MSNYTQALSTDAANNYQTAPVNYGTQRLDDHQVNNQEVLLLIDDRFERVLIKDDAEYQIGRFDSPTRTQVSLNDYRPMEHGISRLHASLFIRNHKLYIMDHASTNGTFVSGERLRPDSPVVLRKGSNILLGRLRVQVIFH